MTVSTAPYYRWANRTDWNSPPYEACSPNLLSLRDHLTATYGGTSLGCHNDRPIRGGSTTMSTHAWGAALDIRFPTRARTLAVAEWLIAWSKELGINAIHDYAQKRIWYPSRGWHPASIQTGDWLHVEVLPTAFADGRPVPVKIAPPIPPPPEDIVAANIVFVVADRLDLGVWITDRMTHRPINGNLAVSLEHGWQKQEGVPAEMLKTHVIPQAALSVIGCLDPGARAEGVAPIVDESGKLVR